MLSLIKRMLPPVGFPASREDNLSIYRKSRTGSDRCSNLPLILLVELSSACNLRCRMCNIHHDSKSGLLMDEGLLEKTFEIAKTAASILPFGLGEPLLHPKIAEILAGFKSFGPKIILISNGMLLDEETSRRLIESGLDQLVISVDAADPLLLSRLRRGADLKRIADNVSTLNRLKKSLGTSHPSLALSVVAQASNFSQLPEIVRMAVEWGGLPVTIAPITAHEHISEIRDERLGKDFPRWREIIEECRREADLSGISIDTQRLYYALNGDSPFEVYKEAIPCPEPFRFMGVRANGDIFPCCNWDVDSPVANVSESGLAGAWQSPAWQSLRADISSGKYQGECRKCMDLFTRPFGDEFA